MRRTTAINSSTGLSARARASAKGKGKDKGIDGQLSFQEGGPGSDHKRVLISVKSGKVDSQKVRDLRGVVEREKSAIGLMITLQKPTKDMKTEATEAKFYTSPWGRHPRIQILTVEELLGGKQVDAIKPGGSTFKAAKRVSEKVRLGEMQQSFSISLSRTLMTAS